MRLRALAVLVLLAFGWSDVALGGAAERTSTTARPNIILILVDDAAFTDFAPALYCNCNVVELSFCHLKDFRRIARRYVMIA